MCVAEQLEERVAAGSSQRSTDVLSTNRGLSTFAITAGRQREADIAFAMMFYTTSTPPHRADSQFVKKYAALLGHKSPSAQSGQAF